MGEESEKRFEAIMNKLFHTPSKSKLDAFSIRHGISPRGKKRISSTPASVGMRVTTNVVSESENSILASDPSAQAALCRPWDRVDLFGRLSTFKSMTWFAKPQAVSPVNCARRGWINVDVDTIACTSCGSRLLFSTPTAWTLQQVDKAAAVFSLKLESGHKLLCPWINSVCSEELAHFPTVSRADLIQDFKKRCLDLSQLIALPIVSSVAIDNIRNPMLEKFLGEVPDCENVETSGTAYAGVVSHSMYSISYQQTQKLISLFGWEPHMLPYIVDFKDGKCQTTIETNVMVKNGKRQKVGAHAMSSTNEIPWASGELQFDPSSAVLNCKLCGASVGLWTFCTVPRPVEYLRLVGSTEVNGMNGSTTCDISYVQSSSGHAIHARDSQFVSNSISTSGITIAGGPPPTMLNYNATISLPVVGKSLRARLLMETESEDQFDNNLSKLNNVQHMSLKGVNVTTDDILESRPEFVAKNLPNIPHNVSDNSFLVENMPLSETTLTDADQCIFYVGEFSHPTSEGNVTGVHVGASEANRRDMVAPENNDLNNLQSTCQDSNVLRATEKLKPFKFGEISKLPSFDTATEFDPIKQHRHFCPWIASTSKFSPGWQQILSAPHGQPEFSFPLCSNAPASPVIEVDDPVASVKKLFTSPNVKRSNV